MKQKQCSSMETMATGNGGSSMRGICKSVSPMQKPTKQIATVYWRGGLSSSLTENDLKNKVKMKWRFELSLSGRIYGVMGEMDE